jgi:hypothetical protein
MAGLAKSAQDPRSRMRQKAAKTLGLLCTKWRSERFPASKTTVATDEVDSFRALFDRSGGYGPVLAR